MGGPGSGRKPGGGSRKANIASSKKAGAGGKHESDKLVSLMAKRAKAYKAKTGKTMHYPKSFNI